MRRSTPFLLACVAIAAACGRSAFQSTTVGGFTPKNSPTPPTVAFQREVTVHHLRVGTASTVALAGFPVMIQFTDSSMRASSFGGHVISTSGLDIIVTAADPETCGGASSCLLPREIVHYDAKAGAVLLWAQVPSLRGAAASSDSLLTLGYGGSQFVSSSTATWDTHYKAVWHLEEGSGATARDSTRSGNLATLAQTAWSSAAMIGFSSLSFDGTSSRAYTGSGSTLTMTSAYTVEAWCRTTVANNGSGRIFFHGPINASPFSSYGFGQVGTNVRYEMNNNGNLDFIDSTTVLAVGSWFRPADSWDGTTLRAYVGTAQEATMGGIGGTIAENNKLSGIGFGNVEPQGPQKFFQGTLQEIRVSDIARAAEWIATGSRNESEPDSFYSVGPETAHPQN